MGYSVTFTLCEAMRSRPLEQLGSVSVPGAISAAFTDVITFRLNRGEQALIRYIGISVDDAGFSYDGSLVFNLETDGSIVSGDLKAFTQKLGTVDKPWETLIPLKAQDTVRLQVRRAVLSDAPNVVKMRISGVRFPEISTPTR